MNTLNLFLRLIAFLLFLILLAFALLQLNDPDPLPWTGFYLICSLVPLLLSFRLYHPGLSLVAIVLCVIVMGIYTGGSLEYLRHAADETLMQTMNPEKPYIEEAREFIGGFIALCLLLLCQLLRKKILAR